MTAIVTRGNAASLHLPDESVDLIVTSPPYFGLRSYQDGGEHYSGQIGDEPTPREYLEAMLACTAEWSRVLKPGGSIFVNLGDKYAGSGSAASNNGTGSSTLSSRSGPYLEKLTKQPAPPKVTFDIPAKSLAGLPWRYALGCVDELGLILRAEIIWAKPNGLPESVTDRVKRSHEQFFHLTKSPRYFSAVDEIREAHVSAHPGRGGLNKRGAEGYQASAGLSATGKWDGSVSSLGKLPGSVWTVATVPLKVPGHLGVDHFAAYPPELIRRIVLGWSPREVCTVCGEGRRPLTEGTPMVWRPSPTAAGRTAPGTTRKSASGTMLAPPTRTIVGYVCGCPDDSAPATPGVVLDPFGGTGTTALVASCFGRVGISVDLSGDYCRLAQWRTSDPGERARVLGVEKPATPVEGQIDLYATASDYLTEGHLS